MTGARELPARDYLALKAAVRDLVALAGGPAQASRHTRGNPSLLSRYGAPHEECFAPLDVIADLEAQAGEPAVTRVLAALHGCVLVTDTEIAAASPNIRRHLGAVTLKTGEVLTALGLALADDGWVDPDEARACLPEIRAAQEALAQLAHDLERKAQGLSPPPTA